MNKKNSVVGPTQMLRDGDAVLTGAKAVDVRKVKERLGTFEKRHRNFSDAERTVKQAENELSSQVEVVKKSVVKLRGVIVMLASAVSLDGEPRTRPFAAFGEKPVSRFTNQPHAGFAASSVRLAKAVLQGKGTSKTTTDVARKVLVAAAELEAALEAEKALESERHHAVTDRNALVGDWERAFHSLKRGVLDAEDNGQSGLYEALFPRKRKVAVAMPAIVAPAPVPSPSPSPTPAAEPPASLAPPADPVTSAGAVH
jgi:hypothetical protein